MVAVMCTRQPSSVIPSAEQVNAQTIKHHMTEGDSQINQSLTDLQRQRDTVCSIETTQIANLVVDTDAQARR